MKQRIARSPAVYGYHAHVYYDADAFPVTKLRETLAAKFPFEIGWFSRGPGIE